jgi:HPt (histidine-containing phosphotransfer) domain-containing protein
MNEKFEYVDIEYLEEISGGDNVFKKELIRIFLKQIPEFVSNMHQFLSEKKYGMLAKEAHTAKSSVLIFKMEETGNILKKIQLLAEKNETATIPEMIRKVETTLNGASMELSVYLNEI